MAKIKTEVEQDDGWSRWVPPVHQGHRMACCDCSLVHNMEFKVVKVRVQHPDGSWSYDDVKGDKYRVMFRASRNNRSTAQMRRHKKEKK